MKNLPKKEKAARASGQPQAVSRPGLVFVILVLHGLVPVVGMLVLVVMRMGMNQIAVAVFMLVMNHLDRCRAAQAPATFTHMLLHVDDDAKFHTNER